MTRVLIVDDEPHLLRALVMNLDTRGYEVTTASNARGALEEVADRPPDLMILDLGLPDRDGLEVIRELRVNRPELPIIVLSARADSHTKVVALDLGATDYVDKPFDMNELLARLRAALRRVGDPSASSRIRMGDVDIDLDARSISRDSEPVHLTPTEWRILTLLVRNPGRLVTARQLLSAVSRQPEHTESSYLRIYLAQLRRKLEADPARPRHLLTEPGVGYRFQP